MYYHFAPNLQSQLKLILIAFCRSLDFVHNVNAEFNYYFEFFKRRCDLNKCLRLTIIAETYHVLIRQRSFYVSRIISSLDRRLA